MASASRRRRRGARLPPEARGEADLRQKLADAEAYRLDLVGMGDWLMEREGALVLARPAPDPENMDAFYPMQQVIAPLLQRVVHRFEFALGDQSPANPIIDAAARPWGVACGDSRATATLAIGSRTMRRCALRRARAARSSRGYGRAMCWSFAANMPEI